MKTDRLHASCAAALLVGMAALSAGCARSPLAGDWRIQPARSSDVDEPLDEARALNTARPASVVLPETLTLPEAVAIALVHHPQLRSFSAARRAREAEMLQANARPNPEIEFGVEEALGTGARRGFDSAEWSLRIAQLFENNDKRMRRADLAEHEALAAEVAYRAGRMAVAAGVARAYVETLAAEALVEVEREHLALSERILATIQRRIDAGDITPTDRYLAAVEVARAKSAVDRAERLVELHRRQFVFSMGVRAEAAPAVTGDLEAVHAPMDLASLERAVMATPDVERWTREILRRRAAVELARASAVPDITAGIGLSYFREDDDVAFSLGVSFPLMIFDRSEGAIEARRWEMREARAEREATVLTLIATAARLHGVIDLARREARDIERDILPVAEQALADLETAYRAGQIGLLSVLDAQRTLTEIRRELVDARGRYHAGAAELDGLLGRVPGATTDAASSDEPRLQPSLTTLKLETSS